MTMTFIARPMRLFLAALILSLAFVAVSAPSQARAAGLTDTQINALINLLYSFDVDSTTIGNVSRILRGEMTSAPTTDSNSEQSTTQALFTASPTSGEAPLTVLFKYTNGRSGCGATSARIEFGDGSSKDISPLSGNTCDAALETIEHIYATEGVYTAKFYAACPSTASCGPKQHVIQVQGAITEEPEDTIPDILVITDRTSFWKHLYSCVLERVADSSSLASYVAGDNWTTLSAFREFFGSSEYHSKNVSNDAYVRTVYKCVLFRTPDVQGLQYWIDRINGQTSTRDYMLAATIDGSEFRSALASRLQNALNNKNTTPAAPIQRLDSAKVRALKQAWNTAKNAMALAEPELMRAVGQNMSAAQGEEFLGRPFTSIEKKQICITLPVSASNNSGQVCGLYWHRTVEGRILGAYNFRTAAPLPNWAPQSAHIFRTAAQALVPYGINGMNNEQLEKALKNLDASSSLINEEDGDSISYVPSNSVVAALGFLPESLYETMAGVTDFLAAVEMAPVYVITEALSDFLFQAGLY